MTTEFAEWLASQTLISLEDDTRVGSPISDADLFPAGLGKLYVERIGENGFKYRQNDKELTRQEAVELLARSVR